MKIRMIPFVGVAAILVVSGLVHGTWTNRWARGEKAEGRELLEPIQDLVADWKPGAMLSVKPEDTPPKTRTTSRQFDSTKGLKSIVVSVCSGYAGEVSVHTPDVCYVGSGFKLKSAITRENVPLAGGKSASFWVADFEKTTVTSVERLRVRWAWTADGNWQAPDYPRFFFARVPVLYKVYIVHPLSDEDALTRDDPYRKFAADLIPQLNHSLTR